MSKLAGKKTITVDEMSQEIDLKRYFKEKPTAKQKELFLEMALERIDERTLDGETIHGGKFKKYSKEYAKKKGVTVTSVDLFLKGDMLESVEGDYEPDENSTRVKIEIDGKTQVAKGFAHHTGDNQKKRPWFGITTDEAKNIAEAVKRVSVKKKIPKEESATQRLERIADQEILKALQLLGIEQVE